MKHLTQLSLVILACLLASCANLGQIELDKDSAKPVALRWLEKIDRGEYAAAYAELDSVPRAELSLADFTTRMALRQRFGQLKAREIRGIDHRTSFARRPDGQYVVIVYATKYARKERGGEGVALARTSTGWKVTGWTFR